MRTRLLIILLAVASLAQVSCRQQRRSGFDAEGNLYGQISISGAWAMYPLTVRWAEEFRKLHPNVRIDLSAGGAGKGMADVLGNMVDIAMVSRDVTQVEVEQGAWYLGVAKDAVVPTFNTQNPFAETLLRQGLKRTHFEKIFLTEGPHRWEEVLGLSGNTKIMVYTRSDASGAGEIWARYLGKEQEDLMGIGVFGDPGIADIVRNDRMGMGFNNIAFCYDITTRRPFEGLGVIPIDVNENGTIDPEEDFYGDLDQLMLAISEGRYPSPPARNLYFVTYGFPKNVAAAEFLRWVLEEGQKYVGEAGYVGLSSESLAHNKQKLLEATPAK